MSRTPAAVRRLPLQVRITAAIEKLEDRERQVLALLLLEKLTPLEAAGALCLTVRQVETSFALAVETLRETTGDRRSFALLRKAS